MKVIVTGATGLVGRALIRSLLSDGHEVTRLVRGEAQGFRAPGTKAVHCEPETGVVNAQELEGHDAVVHLAGEALAGERWDEEKKRRIRESRVKGTHLLAETLAGLKEKPSVLVSASATGFYGDRGDEVLREESASGEGFLSEVCREWEKATLAASQAGIRVVHLRIGFVLSADGGGLPQMLTPFKLGVGGRVGSGQQYISWITLDDLVRIWNLDDVLGREVAGLLPAARPDPFGRCLEVVLRVPLLKLRAEEPQISTVQRVFLSLVLAGSGEPKPATKCN